MRLSYFLLSKCHSGQKQVQDLYPDKTDLTKPNFKGNKEHHRQKAEAFEEQQARLITQIKEY